MQPKTKSQNNLGPLSRREVQQVAEVLKKGTGGFIVVPFKDGVRQTPSYVPKFSSASAESQAIERLKQTLVTMGCDRATCIDTTGKRNELIQSSPLFFGDRPRC